MVANESCTGGSCHGEECFYGTTFSGDYGKPITMNVVCPPGVVGSYVNCLLVGNGRFDAFSLKLDNACAAQTG
eukprot:m.38997 g.38997  ORF g.38997 m.38997 type:complete len:73 (-) comp14690_c0_seq1:94-312(-)